MCSIARRAAAAAAAAAVCLQTAEASPSAKSLLKITIPGNQTCAAVLVLLFTKPSRLPFKVLTFPPFRR